MALTDTPKDDKESYAIMIGFIVLLLLADIFYYLSLSPVTDQESKALFVSFVVLLFGLVVVVLKASFGSKINWIDISGFGDFNKLVSGALLGILGVFFLALFLNGYLCSPQNGILGFMSSTRLIAEGICTPTGYFLIPSEQILPAVLEKTYITIFAPFTEELLFRAILFFTLIKWAKMVSPKFVENNEIPVAFWAAITQAVAFGFFHVFVSNTSCKLLTGVDQFYCVGDNVLSDAIYGFLWLLGNLAWGFSFSFMGHSFNNSLARTLPDATGKITVAVMSSPIEFVVILIPFLVLAWLLRPLSKHIKGSS